VRCRSHTHRATLGGADARSVTRVDWFYRGRPAGADRRAPFSVTLPRARGAIRANATLSDGRRATYDRVSAACR
jgi:hypothetical protein